MSLAKTSGKTLAHGLKDIPASNCKANLTDNKLLKNNRLG